METSHLQWHIWLDGLWLGARIMSYRYPTYPQDGLLAENQTMADMTCLDTIPDTSPTLCSFGPLIGNAGHRIHVSVQSRPI